MRSSSIVAITILCLLDARAIAQTTELPPPTEDPIPLDDPNAFQLTFTPVIWLTSFNGNAGVADVVFDVDASFLDIVDNSDSVFGLYGMIDGTYKRLVFQFNGAYSTATFSEQRGRTRTGPAGGGVNVSAEADLEMDAAWFEGYGGYRFVDMPLGDEAESNSRFLLDGFIGGRITSLKLDATIRVDGDITLPGGEVLEAGRRNSLDQKEEWFEPFIGARAGFELGKHWNINLRGDVGGFGVDHSEFAWQASGAVGYRWWLDGWTLNLFAGYRALGQDYEQSGFTWDSIVHGPVLGAQFTIVF